MFLTQERQVGGCPYSSVETVHERILLEWSMLNEILRLDKNTETS